MPFPKKIWLSPLLSLILSEPSRALDFHGYMRSGLGFGENGTDQLCFSAPGAPAKFRLGNECETYIETKFTHEFDGDSPRSNQVSWRAQLTFAYLSSAHRDFEPSNTEVTVGANNTVTSNSDMTMALREAYVAADHLISEGSRLWVGKRYYRRHDINMLDFYYLDNSGPGFGLENLDLASGKLHSALTHNIPKGGGPAQKNIDLRYSDLKLGRSNLESALIYALVGTADAETGIESFAAQSGLSLHAFLSSPLGDSARNLLVLQFGKGLYGANGNFGASIIDQRGGYGSQNIARDNASLILARRNSSTKRLIENFTWEQPGAAWSIDAVLFYQEADFNGEISAASQDALPNKRDLSFGIKPSAHISQNFSLVSELGLQRSDNAFYDATKAAFQRADLRKLTLAPSFAPRAGIFVRPALRFFVTYAEWNEAARGRVGRNQADQDRTTGLSLGTQVEAWW